MPASDSFTWEGHTLVGWAFDSTLTAEEFEIIVNGGTVAGKTSGKGDVFRPNVTVFADNKDKTALNTSSNTLYAIWETEKYTVTVKKVVAAGEDTGLSYAFTATAAGGEYTLSAGDASFMLNDGGTKIFANVPYGTELTFQETPAAGYSIQRVDAKQTSLPDKTPLDEAHYIDLGGANGKAYTIKGNTVITYTNEKTKEQKLRIRKIGNDAADGLAGATFSLTATGVSGFSDLTNLVSLDGTTDAAQKGYLPGNDGTDATLFVLPLGTYTLSETAAPAWYDGLSGGVTLTVTATGVAMTKGNAADGVVLSGPVSGVYTLTVTNTRKLATVTIVKTVDGTAADQEQTYAFSQTGLTGGAATFTLRGSDNAATSTAVENRTAFENIPYGTVFTIIEDSYPDFDTTIAISNEATPVTAIRRSTGDVVVDGDVTITYVNTRNRQLVSVWKTDLNHTALTGASFALYKAEDYNDSTGRLNDGATAVVPSTGVGSNGVLPLGTLAVGEYRLVETQAPAGYNPAESAIRIFVRADGVTAMQGTGYAEIARNVEGNAYRQYWVSGQDDATWQMRVWNNPGVVLPSTGGPGVVLPSTGGPGVRRLYLLGLLLTALSCGGWMLRRKRKPV